MKELCYRITFETYNKDCPNEAISKKEIISDVIYKPTNCLDFSMGLTNQINLIQGVQDNLLTEKVKLANVGNEDCSHCVKKLHKYGSHTSWFHDVLTDHQVKIPRLLRTTQKFKTAYNV
jgi:hypothetical protein